jgi:hypothetical protein
VCVYTHRDTHRQTHRHTDTVTQTLRHTDTDTDRQTDRQTDRHMHVRVWGGGGAFWGGEGGGEKLIKYIHYIMYNVCVCVCVISFQEKQNLEKKYRIHHRISSNRAEEDRWQHCLLLLAYIYVLSPPPRLDMCIVYVIGQKRIVGIATASSPIYTYCICMCA